MSSNSHKFQMQATAPSIPDEFANVPPPPTYEESLQMSTTPQQYRNSFVLCQQQQQILHHSPTYNYASSYQLHCQQQQSSCTALPAPMQSGIGNPKDNVIYLSKGAKVRTTASGAISIPPPPPGCTPTPGQLAAMSGKPVIIKKQKKSFF